MSTRNRKKFRMEVSFPRKPSQALDECIICLEPYIKEMPEVKLECNHSGHAICLSQLRRSGLIFKCPMCRQEISNNDRISIRKLAKESKKKLIRLKWKNASRKINSPKYKEELKRIEIIKKIQNRLRINKFKFFLKSIIIEKTDFFTNSSVPSLIDSFKNVDGGILQAENWRNGYFEVNYYTGKKQVKGNLINTEKFLLNAIPWHISRPSHHIYDRIKAFKDTSTINTPYIINFEISRMSIFNYINLIDKNEQFAGFSYLTNDEKLQIKKKVLENIHGSTYMIHENFPPNSPTGIIINTYQKYEILSRYFNGMNTSLFKRHSSLDNNQYDFDEFLKNMSNSINKPYTNTQNDTTTGMPSSTISSIVYLNDENNDYLNTQFFPRNNNETKPEARWHSKHNSWDNFTEPSNRLKFFNKEGDNLKEHIILLTKPIKISNHDNYNPEYILGLYYPNIHHPDIFKQQICFPIVNVLSIYKANNPNFINNDYHIPKMVVNNIKSILLYRLKNSNPEDDSNPFGRDFSISDDESNPFGNFTDSEDEFDESNPFKFN
jgi:hypothetical protein